MQYDIEVAGELKHEHELTEYRSGRRGSMVTAPTQSAAFGACATVATAWGSANCSREER